jgi:hypothetical protein
MSKAKRLLVTKSFRPFALAQYARKYGSASDIVASFVTACCLRRPWLDTKSSSKSATVDGGAVSVTIVGVAGVSRDARNCRFGVVTIEQVIITKHKLKYLFMLAP